MARTIESPGVQITEIDLSTRPTIPTGTSVFVAGFAPQGPTDEVLPVTTLNEFVSIYGQPESPAERYFYHSVAPLFNTQANVFTYRLPYGQNSGYGFGNNYGALVYPCSAVNIEWNGTPGNSPNYGKYQTTFNQASSNNIYIFGKPTHIELTEQQYFDLQQGNGGFQWSNVGKTTFYGLSDMGNAGMIVLNKSQSTINNLFEGYYVGITDNTHLNPATDFDCVNDVLSLSQSLTSTKNYTTLPTTRLNFSLSSLSDNHPVTYGFYGEEGVSVSEVLENASTFSLQGSNWDDSVILGLFKLRQSVFSPNTIKLDYTFSERVVGSFDYWRQINSQQGGQPLSFFLETREDQSPNVSVLVNPYISHQGTSTWLNTGGTPSNKVRFVWSGYSAPDTYLRSASADFGIFTYTSAPMQIAMLSGALLGAYNTLGRADSLFAVGTVQTTTLTAKDLGSIPQKLDRMFNVTEDTELYNFDLVVDGGMSTIFAVSQYLDTVPTLSSNVKYFNDNVYVAAISGLYVTTQSDVRGPALTFSSNYQAITNKYSTFAGLKTKNTLYIADLPRHIFVQGANSLPLDDVNNNFSLNIYSPIKNVTGSFNTSYACTYGNWVKVFDNVLDDFCWVPFSGFAAAAMANTDTLFQPWYAPAGFTRGNVTGVTQLAITPKQKQRDQLYKISVNPVTFFPNEGYVIYGQKTLLKQPSAFDRINVRRLFLSLEKATNNTVKFFVFEPNTLLTRTRVVNTLTPIFENAKNTEGLYDYLIVCDERNNTPDIIDQNELVVDIYLKPTRTAEFILVNFYATRTSANFQELIG